MLWLTYRDQWKLFSGYYLEWQITNKFYIWFRFTSARVGAIGIATNGNQFFYCLTKSASVCHCSWSAPKPVQLGRLVLLVEIYAVVDVMQQLSQLSGNYSHMCMLLLNRVCMANEDQPPFILALSQCCFSIIKSSQEKNLYVPMFLYISSYFIIN